MKQLLAEASQCLLRAGFSGGATLSLRSLILVYLNFSLFILHTQVGESLSRVQPAAYRFFRAEGRCPISKGL